MLQQGGLSAKQTGRFLCRIAVYRLSGDYLSVTAYAVHLPLGKGGFRCGGIRHSESFLEPSALPGVFFYKKAEAVWTAHRFRLRYPEQYFL